MRFDVSSDIMLSRLQPMGKVIAAKNSLPILDCFLFELEGNALRVTAADTGTRMAVSVGVTDTRGGGSVAIPAKVLLDSLRELAEQPVTFEINDETREITVYFRNGKYNFMGQEADAYPQPSPLKDGSVSVSMGAQALLDGVARTLFSAGDDELRPVMNGICMDFQTDGLTFVATDGRKLVRMRNPDVKSPSQAKFILPKKPANLLRGLLSKESGEVSVRFDDNSVHVACAGFEMVCRQIEGRYPNYNSVIPQGQPFRVTVDRGSFQNALKRVSVFSNPDSGLVRLDLRDNTINVFAQDIDYSTSAEESIGCQYDGTGLSIGFKVTDLIEILGNVSTEKVVIGLSDPSKAGLIVPSENDGNTDLLMLLMPMQLKD